LAWELFSLFQPDTWFISTWKKSCSVAAGWLANLAFPELGTAQPQLVFIFFNVIFIHLSFNLYLVKYVWIVIFSTYFEMSWNVFITFFNKASLQLD
jgi:hypothetical protein